MMLLSKSTTIPKQWRSTLFSPNPRRVGSSSSSSRRRSSSRQLHQRRAAVHAVISSDDKSAGNIAISGEQQQQQQQKKKIPMLGPVPESVEVRVVLTVKNKMNENWAEELQDRWEYFLAGIGQGILVQLVSNDIDPVTNSGKRSVEAAVRGWLPPPSIHPYIVEYAANFTVDSDFGCPGAIIIKNLHDREFHLMNVAVHGLADAPVFFHANSWIHSRLDSPESRVIFSNQVYLPSQTPDGLKALREDVLVSHRGDGEGKREKFERIYDYAPYNDLGDPEKGADLARPLLGGEERPYPRRCRTGRPPIESDQIAESRVEKPHSVYVPRDEDFEEMKHHSFSSGALRGLLHNLIPALIVKLSSSDDQFECFTDIDSLYKDRVLLKGGEQKSTVSSFVFSLLTSLLSNVTSIGEKIMKYDVPTVISKDPFSWFRDTEFARQMLAGVNPVSIERLREFPILSKLDPAVYGPPESAITKECLEHELKGMSLEEAIKRHKLFILDYHDLLLPFVEKINSIEGRKTYASRTIFFLTDIGTLKPIAIELSLPQSKRVYTHANDATSSWLWNFAKAHVCTNDAGVHQLVNHWLRTHACMEPYIIASHRQLSSMHPVFKLLHPHMRYTMEINALARQSLVNGGGIIEECFSPGKYSMEVSSAAYKSTWRFDMEALPADLIRRGMAVEDPTMPCGVKLVIEDYPYAADGLLVWSATEDWVRDYTNHYYPNDAAVRSDAELQAWWAEIRNEGHRDKRDEAWWPALASKEDLIGILATMIWTASGQHAAINFGQYPFGGYMPNRPTLMKRLLPTRDDPGFLEDPQRAFLSSVPSLLQVTQVMAVQDTLSTHSPDEEYLGQVKDSDTEWGHDTEVRGLFEKFSERLRGVEKTMEERNGDCGLRNRNGAGVPSYQLLHPTSGPGVTGRGIPNSISI